MYPLIRFGLGLSKSRKQAPLGIFDPHVSQHRCLPWDIDPWMELNNGRTLTLYDLGRIPLGQRTGLHRVLRSNGWGMTVAGSAVRYRRRIRNLARFSMVSRMLGWDARFFYLDQSMWLGGDCAGQVLIRSAVTSDKGIVDPGLVAQQLGHAGPSPDLPDWVQAWTRAEAERPWPPDSGRFLPGRG